MSLTRKYSNTRSIMRPNLHMTECESCLLRALVICKVRILARAPSKPSRCIKRACAVRFVSNCVYSAIVSVCSLSFSLSLVILDSLIRIQSTDTPIGAA